MTDFGVLLRTLVEAEVEFVIVGGAAGTAHGAARLTQDLDVVYGRSSENLRRVVAALAPLHPYPRGAPLGLPFRWDVRTLENGLNFTLVTSAGFLDLLGEIAAGRSYEELRGDAITIEAFGVRCQCLSLEKLIATKRAAGRPKDFEALAELEALRDARGGLGSAS